MIHMHSKDTANRVTTNNKGGILSSINNKAIPNSSKGDPSIPGMGDIQTIQKETTRKKIVAENYFVLADSFALEDGRTTVRKRRRRERERERE